MFYEVVDQLALAAALGVLAPIATLIGGRIVRGQRQKFALRQIQANYKVGMKLHKVSTPDGTVLIRECEIVTIIKGQIAVRTPDGKAEMFWSNEEFNDLHPLVDVSDGAQ